MAFLSIDLSVSSSSSSIRRRHLSPRLNICFMMVVTMMSLTGRSMLFFRNVGISSVSAWTPPSSLSSFHRRDTSVRSSSSGEDLKSAEEMIGLSGYKLPQIQWYPGHIAKAERQLSEILKAVDVLIEVRDGRAPKATAHPMVGQWAAGKPRIVVLTHSDAVPSISIQEWTRAYENYGAGRWDSTSSTTDTTENTNSINQVAHTAQQRRRNISKNQKHDDKEDVLRNVESVLYVNGKVGKGIPSLIRAIHKSGQYVHEKRERRGLNPRPLRVGVLGFPNVGKSTIINKLLGGKKRAKTANTPGVTRSLQWIRVSTSFSSGNSGNTKKSFELLDSPGIIPSSIPNQNDALLLAACNSIGDAAYDNQAVAAHLCEWVKSLHLMGKGHVTVPKWRDICKERYAGLDPLEEREFRDSMDGTVRRLPTGEDMLQYVAEYTPCNGDLENAARKILQDFRAGRWGPAALQIAPTSSQKGDGETPVPIQNMRNVHQQKQGDDTDSFDYKNQQAIRAQQQKQAVQTAQDLGLELPPSMQQEQQSQKDEETKESEVGKGLFDGW